MSKADVDNVKEVIKIFYPNARLGIFDCRNVVGDAMTTIYIVDRVQIDICYEYEYFEVLGLTKEEFSEVEKFYNSLGDSYSGVSSKESWVQKSDAIISMAGAHQVESKITNFDRELAAMTPKSLAKLYSKVIECLWCNCREICGEIGSTRNCAEVLENWLESEVTENEIISHYR